MHATTLIQTQYKDINNEEGINKYVVEEDLKKIIRVMLPLTNNVTIKQEGEVVLIRAFTKQIIRLDTLKEIVNNEKVANAGIIPLARSVVEIIVVYKEQH